MSQSYSPCAACKYLRRKCTNECVFGAYFPQEEPKKFSDVHKVFGASNVAKLLNDLPEAEREGAVESLAYEADARITDPVYGSMRLISILKQRLKQYQTDLYNAQKELSAYVGPSGSAVLPYNTQQAQMMGGLPANVASHPMVIRQQLQYQKMTDAHQVAAVREQELLNTCEQQQQVAAQQVGQQQSEQLVMFETEYQIPAGGGFNQISVSEAMAPAMPVGSIGGPYQIQQHTQEHPQFDHLHNQIHVQHLVLQQQEQQQILSFAQPLQVDPQQQHHHQILSFAQPLQVDPQQQQQQQHRDESEGVGESIGPSLGPFGDPYQIQQRTQEHHHLHHHHQVQVQQLLTEQQLQHYRDGSEEQSGSIVGTALRPYNRPYQIHPHTQVRPQILPDYHHELEVQQLWTVKQPQQEQILLTAQPLHVDSKQQLKQHRDGSEEEGGGNGGPFLGSFDGPYHIQQRTQEHNIHHHNHQLEVQQPLPEQQQQPQVDPQHRDGNEEEGGSNIDPL